MTAKTTEAIGGQPNGHKFKRPKAAPLLGRHLQRSHIDTSSKPIGVANAKSPVSPENYEAHELRLEKYLEDYRAAKAAGKLDDFLKEYKAERARQKDESGRKLTPNDYTRISPSDALQERQDMLGGKDAIVAYEKYLRQQWFDERGEKAPENISLVKMRINQFQTTVRDAEAIRRKIWKLQERLHEETLPDAKISIAAQLQELTIEFSNHSGDVKGILYWGPAGAFEAAYREYIHQQKDFFKLMRLLKERVALKQQLNQPAWTPTPNTDGFVPLDEEDQARLEYVSRASTIERDREGHVVIPDHVKETVGMVYAEGTPEYAELLKIVLAQYTNVPTIDVTIPSETKAPKKKKGKSKEEGLLTKHDIKLKMKKLEDEAKQLWALPHVQAFFSEWQIKQYLEAHARGDRVFKTPSVIGLLNTMNDWDNNYNVVAKTLLVGPPGTGKTTVIDLFDDLKGRKYRNVDFSEEVSRFFLFGSREINAGTPADYYKQVLEHLTTLSPDAFKAFIKTNAKRLTEAFGYKGDEAIVAAIAELREELTAGKNEMTASIAESVRGKKDKQAANEAIELQKRLDETLALVRSTIEEGVRDIYHKELGDEVARILEQKQGKLGWRDGIILASLRQGISLHINEITRGELSPSLYDLLETREGGTWFCPETGETFTIPIGWGISGSANIGLEFGSKVFRSPAAQRFAGRVGQVGYPPANEVFQVFASLLSMPDGRFVRSPGYPPRVENDYMKYDYVKAYQLVAEVYPSIMQIVAETKNIMPISYRIDRAIADALVTQRDRRSGEYASRPTQTTFDKAVFDVLVGTNALYEGEIPRARIVQVLVRNGILLDDESIKRDVIYYMAINTKTGAVDKEKAEAEYKDIREKYMAAREEKRSEQEEKAAKGLENAGVDSFMLAF